MLHREPAALTALGPAASADYDLAVHVTDLATMRRRAGSRTLAAPRRVDTHVITLFTRGRGRHTVDFETHPCASGTLLWVRPGQVQQFQSPSRLGGTQIRFTAFEYVPGRPGPISCLLNATGGVVTERLAAEDLPAVANLFESLAAEYTGAADESAHHRELLSHLLLGLLLRIDRIHRADHTDRAYRAHDDADLYRRFIDQLELDFTRAR